MKSVIVRASSPMGHEINVRVKRLTHAEFKALYNEDGIFAAQASEYIVDVDGETDFEEVDQHNLALATAAAMRFFLGLPTQSKSDTSISDSEQ